MSNRLCHQGFPIFSFFGSSKKIIVVLLIGLISMGIITGYEYEVISTQHNNNSFGIKGTFSLYKNGQLVIQSDQITYIGYATAICKIFNDSTACSQSNTAWSNAGSGAQVGVVCKSGQNHQLLDFYSSSFCDMTGVALTNSMGTPTIGGNCPSIITTNGMNPAHATTVFSQNTQTVTLSVSWIATGSQNFDGVCLIGWNDISNGAIYWTGGINSFAMQSFSIQSVSSGQTWSAQWTFSF